MRTENSLFRCLFDFCTHPDHTIPFCDKQTAFLECIFPDELYGSYSLFHPNTMSNMFRRGVFPSYVISYFSKTENTRTILGHLEGFVQRLGFYGQALAKTLAECLASADPELPFREEIRAHISSLAAKGEVVQCIYDYLFYCVTGSLHPDIIYSRYAGMDEDLAEYKSEVLLKVGSSGKPGVMTILHMAKREKPNIIALYEAGEIEFYGRGPSGQPDYEAAYNYYRKAWTHLAHHPLAGWSIGYMLYRYEELDIRLPAFDGLAREDRIRLAVQYFKESEALGCSAAANSLGLVARDEAVPASLKTGLESAGYYFNKAAGLGYVYGKNNYAMHLRDEAERCSQDREKTCLYREFYKYLKESADLGEPWAANRIGLYHYDGLEVCGSVIIAKDREEAHRYFCISAYTEGDAGACWGKYNLVCKYHLEPDESAGKKMPLEHSRALLMQAAGSSDPKLKALCAQALEELGDTI